MANNHGVHTVLDPLNYPLTVVLVDERGKCLEGSASIRLQSQGAIPGLSGAQLELAVAGQIGLHLGSLRNINKVSLVPRIEGVLHITRRRVRVQDGDIQVAEFGQAARGRQPGERQPEHKKDYRGYQDPRPTADESQVQPLRTLHAVPLLGPRRLDCWWHFRWVRLRGQPSPPFTASHHTAQVAP